MTDYESKVDTVEQLRNDLSDAESLADTPFSAVFHAARTSSSRYSSASVGIRVTDDGEVEVSDVVKTQQGQHVRWPDKWDGSVSIPQRAFMPVGAGRAEIRRNLRGLKRTYMRKATCPDR